MVEKQTEKDKKNEGGLIETISIVIQAVLLALVIRVVLFQPFSIPSESMQPTLEIGDYLIVSKYSYGYSKHSFPWSAGPFSGRIFKSMPQRGDVAVFKTPTDNRTDYIKRVMGLPGDKIQMINGAVYINGEAVEREELAPLQRTDAIGRVTNTGIKRYRETLENGTSYITYDVRPLSQGDNTPVFEVPEDHVFMIGDNRDRSNDSRLAVGFVPVENLVGKAQFIFFSIEDGGAWQFWRWPTQARFSRIFNDL